MTVVIINGKTVGTLDRRLNQDSLLLDLPPGKATLDILVENMGPYKLWQIFAAEQEGHYR